MFVWLFSVEIQTPKQIGMKFGMEVVLKGGRFGCGKGVRGASGVSGASAVHFDKNFIKQKFQGAPDLVGADHLYRPQIQIWKDQGPMSFWSHGH